MMLRLDHRGIVQSSVGELKVHIFYRTASRAGKRPGNAGRVLCSGSSRAACEGGFL